MNYININETNRSAVVDFIISHWYTSEMVVRGEVVDMAGLDGIIAEENRRIIGLVTYRYYNQLCEIMSFDSLLEGQGIGSRLLELAVEAAKAKQCRKVVLITTNDNLNAMRFYQKRGFDMTHLYWNALAKSRELKPEIPMIGEDGIPLRHEIEFERSL